MAEERNNDLKHNIPMVRGEHGGHGAEPKALDPWERPGYQYPLIRCISVSARLVALHMVSLPRYCGVMMDHPGPHSCCLALLKCELRC